jgi:hypothetical protein
MARFLTHDETRARELLAGAGVLILSVDDPRHDEVMAEVLGDQTMERGRIVAEPPADANAARTGMGAWHVNEVNEFETVVSGDGILEFMTAEGPVAVLLSAGDIMAVARAEHRYQPLSAQEWILRFAGDDLGAKDTGRESGPWPSA